MKSQIILLVEGTESFRSILSDHLKRQYMVREFQQHENAFQFLVQNSVGLILYALPQHVDEPEAFIREVREHSRMRHLPLIVLYHRSQGLMVRDCYLAGADVCLEKPFGLELLPEVISMALKNRELAFHYSRRLTLLPEAYVKRESETEFFMQRVNRFIRENIDQMELQVAVLADEMALSVSQLDRRIVRITGVSPKQYIRNYRMKVAYELLSEHQGNITEVASLTGFRSVSYFSTKFRERYGYTPTQFKHHKSAAPCQKHDDFPPRVA